MTVVNPKSISGITSITTASGGDNLLTFHTNNTTERLRIHSTGEVTIGTATGTGNNLTVQDAGTSTSAGGNICARFQSNGSGRDATIQLSDNVANSATISMLSSALVLKQAGTETIRITSAGKVLIGTTTPQGNANADDLVVSTSGHSGITIRSGTSHNSNLFFADGVSGGDEYRGWVDYKHNDNTMSFGTNASERLRITSTGVVHIGNTFSAHSEGDDLVIGGAGWRGMTIYGEGGGGVIQFADDGDNRIGQILYSHSSNHMLFRTNGNVDRMMITDDGYIGAGVASPSARFHAQDDSATETVMIKLRNYKSGVNTKPTIHFEAATSTGQGATSEIQGLAGTDAGGSNSANDSGMKFIVRHGGAGTQREAFTLKADGNMYFPSGQGISFSATSDGTSMSSELFDDYEEGTFTPLLGGSNYGTYNVTGTGKYTRVGRAIFCEWKFSNKDLDNNASGQMRIRGWPFAFSANNDHRPISSNFMMHNVQLPTSGDNNIYNIYGDSNGIAMNGMRNNDDTGWTSWDIANFESGTMYFEGSCFMMAS